MSEPHVNAIRKEIDYYATSKTRKNVPNGQAMMLLVCRLGMREFEYEVDRIASHGNKMQLPEGSNGRHVESLIPVVVNERMSGPTSASSSATVR